MSSKNSTAYQNKMNMNNLVGVAIGTEFGKGGWALYLQDGVPSYHYNFLGLQRFTIAVNNPLPPGKATIRF